VRLGMGLGVELKETYFRQAIKNLELVDQEIVHEPLYSTC
jgi:hypothetical protein